MNSLVQCRSGSVVDNNHVLEHDDRSRGPAKLARPDDSFSSLTHGDLKIHMALSNSNGGGTPLGSLVRTNSMLSDASLTGCSPTDGTLLGNDSSLLLRSDSLLSWPPHRLSSERQISYDLHALPIRSASGLPVGVSRDMLNLIGLHDRTGMSLGQRREYELQLLIFKYIVSGLNVPSELLLSFRNTLVGLSGISPAAYHMPSLGWGNYHLGFQNNSDPEPHRCRRTDGKKWRCSREVVPDQKYCERHMHRGKNRRKLVDNPSSTTLNAVSSAITVPNKSISASPNNNNNNNTSSTTTNNSNNNSALITNGNNSFRATSGTMVQQERARANSSSFSIKSFTDCDSLDAESPTVVSFNPFQHGNTSGSGSGSALSSAKDYYRYLDGISKSDMDLGPQHMFFAENSVSNRGQDQSQNQLNSLSLLSTAVNNGSPWSTKSEQQQQQQHHFLMDNNNNNNNNNNNGYSEHNDYQSQHQGREGEGEGQPLRHFFDDWPRSTRDSSGALSWADIEDEKRTSHGSSSTTRLSISIPRQLSAAADAKLSPSPLLKLSMSSTTSPASDDGTRVGMGLGLASEDADRNNPAAANQSTTGSANNNQGWMMMMHGRNGGSPLGGPLAEALRSKANSDDKATINIMTSSPTGVLQANAANASSSTFASFSDSSSGRSSPRTTSIFPGLL